MSSALEIQTAIMAAATQTFQGRDEETDWVLAAWREVLDSLARDPQELIGRLDWVTKKWLLDAFAESEGSRLGAARGLRVAAKPRPRIPQHRPG